MAPKTAFCFAITGISLAGLAYRHSVLPVLSTYLSFTVLLIALFSVVGYSYNAREFYNLSTYIPMAFPIAALFLLLSSTALVQRGDNYFSAFLQSPLQGSKMARFLLPFAALIPIMSGKLRTYGQENNLYSSEFGTTLFVLVTVLLFTLLIWRSALLMNKANIRLNQEIENRRVVGEQLHLEQKKEFERQQLRDKIKLNRILLSATIDAQEREKKQIGMELHDHINQILASTKMYIELARTQGDMRNQLLKKIHRSAGLCD